MIFLPFAFIIPILLGSSLLIFSGLVFAVPFFVIFFIISVVFSILGALFFKKKYKVLDSSLFVDGRIISLIKEGYIEGPFLIPKFVISELHRLADSEHSIRRAKGRRALDNVAALQEIIKVKIDRKQYDIKDVDTKLIKLTKYRKAILVTIDFNLTKVANIEKIPVLNINMLATLVRKIFMPNEEIEIELLKKGDKENQSVGYLEDGTMVVVSHGPIGQRVIVRVTSTYPTQAGRIIFAKVK